LLIETVGGATKITTMKKGNRSPIGHEKGGRAAGFIKKQWIGERRRGGEKKKKAVKIKKLLSSNEQI